MEWQGKINKCADSVSGTYYAMVYLLFDSTEYAWVVGMRNAAWHESIKDFGREPTEKAAMVKAEQKIADLEATPGGET